MKYHIEEGILFFWYIILERNEKDIYSSSITQVLVDNEIQPENNASVYESSVYSTNSSNSSNKTNLLATSSLQSQIQEYHIQQGDYIQLKGAVTPYCLFGKTYNFLINYC